MQEVIINNESLAIQGFQLYRGPRFRRDFVDALASPQPAISFLEFYIWCLEIKNPRLFGDFKSLACPFRIFSNNNVLYC